MNMKHLYTSLGSGVTSGSVTDHSIVDDSVIEIYFDNTDYYIDSTSQSGHTVYFTVGGNTTGTNVCVVVNNLTDFTPYNDADIQERVTQTEQDITELETTLDGLDASDINYDEHSTLYSAMGDIDLLETTSKNLVGAINEVKESGGGGSIAFSSGALTAVNNIRNLGSTRWYKLGKLCIVSVEDLQFQSNGSYEGYQNSPIYMSGIPLPVRNYNAFSVRRADNRDAYNTCRLVVTKNNGIGVIKPHYTSVVGNTDNYYGIIAYECVE